MEILFLDDHWEMWFTWHPGKNTVSVFNWFLNPVMLGTVQRTSSDKQTGPYGKGSCTDAHCQGNFHPFLIPILLTQSIIISLPTPKTIVCEYRALRKDSYHPPSGLTSGSLRACRNRVIFQ